MMHVRIERHVARSQTGSDTNAQEYTTCPEALRRAPVFIASGNRRRNQRSPGSVGSASSSSSGLSRASSSGSSLRFIVCDLGPAYFLGGVMGRPIPVMNQKGEQVWRAFGKYGSTARRLS